MNFYCLSNEDLVKHTPYKPFPVYCEYFPGMISFEHWLERVPEDLEEKLREGVAVVMQSELNPSNIKSHLTKDNAIKCLKRLQYYYELLTTGKTDKLKIEFPNKQDKISQVNNYLDNDDNPFESL